MKRYKITVIITWLFLFVGNLSAQQNLVWQVVSRMPFPVGGCKALVKDSLIYVLGGYSDSTNQNMDIIQIYNPSTNTWLSNYLKMGSRRSGFIADNYRDGFIICGGIDSLNLNARGLEFFNPASHTGPEILGRNLIFNRLFAAGKVHNNSLFLFGGNLVSPLGDSLHVSFLVEYDLQSRSIAYKSEALFGGQLTNQQMIALVNDDIYLFGGVLNVITNKVYKFNTQTKNFTSDSPQLLSIRAGGEAVYDGHDKIYIIGGRNETQTLSSVEIYSLGGSQNAVAMGPSLNDARKNFASVYYNGNIYVFGGFDKSSRTVATVEKLDYATNVSGGDITAPKAFKLYNNYPNPFNAGTVIKFSLPEKSQVSIDIFNMLGEHVANLIRGSFSDGEHSINWNGTDDNGRILSSGLYIYQLKAGNYMQAKKMTMIK